MNPYAEGVATALGSIGLTPQYKEGAASALTELGLEKNAWLGQGLSALGRGVWSQAGKVFNAPGKVIGGVGKGTLGLMSRAGVPKGATRFLHKATKGMGREAGQFGMFSGAISAATAEKGDRVNAFGRGFLGGALGGAAWRGGGNLTRMGLRKALGKRHMGNLSAHARSGFFGGKLKVPKGQTAPSMRTKEYWKQRWGQMRGGTGMARKTVGADGTRQAIQGGVGLKSMGAKALLGGLPLAGAIGASFAVPHDLFEKKPQSQFQSPQYRPHAAHPLYYSQELRGR